MEPQRLETTKNDNIFVNPKVASHKHLKSFDYDKRMDNSEDEYDIVNRRGPINPIKTFKTLREKTKGNKQLNKIKNDPRLKNNPLRGRLAVCISTTTAIIFIFIAEMIFNKSTFGGRCLTRVLYKREMDEKPLFIPITHGACEYNLRTDSASRVFMGPSTADLGWPITTSVPNEISIKWNFPFKTEKFTFQANTITAFGGLETNMIRNYGERYRLLWSTFMHKGLVHLCFNLASQIQLLWMIEPDWGFIRTFLLYLISAVGSSLTSAALDPCHVTIGSSGVLYGLYGGLVPYIIEYWSTLPYPLFLILFIIISIIIGFLMGFTENIDNYAHLGGCLYGLLWGFTSIRSVSIFDRCRFYESAMLSPFFCWMFTKNYKDILRLRINIKKNSSLKRSKKNQNNTFQTGLKKKNKQVDKIIEKLSNHGSPPFRNNFREWVVRLCSLVSMIGISVLLALLVFEPKLYTKFKPWGQPKFTGYSKCVCCHIQNIKKLFKGKELSGFQEENQLYWCFDHEKTAKNFCGSVLGLGQTDDIISNSSKAAHHLYNSLF